MYERIKGEESECETQLWELSLCAAILMAAGLLGQGTPLPYTRKSHQHPKPGDIQATEHGMKPVHGDTGHKVTDFISRDSCAKLCHDVLQILPPVKKKRCKGNK